MTDKADHIAWAAEAVAVFQKHCRTGDDHVIADLICDLGHLAETLASTSSARSGGALGIGMRSITLATPRFLAPTWQSKSSSSQQPGKPMHEKGRYHA
jgi:hypothetical protein